MLANPTSPVSLGGDTVAVAIIPLTWMHYLPDAAAFATLVWVGLQVYTWVINKKWKPDDR